MAALKAEVEVEEKGRLQAEVEASAAAAAAAKLEAKAKTDALAEAERQAQEQTRLQREKIAQVQAMEARAAAEEKAQAKAEAEAEFEAEAARLGFLDALEYAGCADATTIENAVLFCQKLGVESSHDLRVVKKLFLDELRLPAVTTTNLSNALDPDWRQPISQVPPRAKSTESCLARATRCCLSTLEDPSNFAGAGSNTNHGRR